MMTKLKSLPVLGLLMLVLACPALAQTSLYISPAGSDKNAGTKQKPLATLQAAQAMARKAKGAVNIFPRSGTYYLPAPVKFGPQDARTAAAAITYKAQPGEKAVVSGAVPLKLQWKAY